MPGLVDPNQHMDANAPTELAVASVVAFAAALGFRLARRLGPRSRAAAWLSCSAIVASSPCLITLDAKPLRFADSLLAVGLLVKLYDLHAEARLGRHPSLNSYLAYLLNFFWLVLRKRPGRRPPARDVQRLGFLAPAALLSVIPCVILFRVDWSAVPLALEHALKVPAVVLSMALTTNALAAVHRLLGGLAIDPMRSPLAAPTPADFWRRWNRPAHQFLDEYAFKPAGGLRRPVRATLVTFGVSGLVHEYVFGIASGHLQGWQLLFFSIQGCAAVASRGFRPKRGTPPPWVAGTCVFNLASSWLFFMGVDDVLPFYARRDP